MSSASTPDNGIHVGRDAGHINAIGRDNNGIIDNRTFHAPSRPLHQLRVEGRRATFVTDRLMLVLNIFMAVTSVGSLGLAVAQAYPAIAADGFLRGLSRLGFQPPLWVAAALVAGLLAFWLSDRRAWLRRRTYGARPWLGRLPEGRRDPNGATRLYLTRVRGTCAIDGAPMRLVSLPTRTATFSRADGSSGEKPAGYRAHLICTRAPGEQGHVARVDPSSSQAWSAGQPPSTSARS